MRAIKFRAWSVHGEKMIEPTSRTPLSYVADQDERRHIWMQYTGLKDSKGVEIYEGDIVSTDEYIFIDEGKQNYVGLVEYDDEYDAQFVIVLHCVNAEKRGISDGICQGFSDYEGQLAVIGNRFENPELLAEKESPA